MRLSRPAKPELKLAACFICALIALYLYMKGSAPNPDLRSQPIIAQTQTATRELTPEPTEAPTPIDEATVKQIDNEIWRVHLVSKDEWYDTGIPLIANCFLGIDPLDVPAGSKWLIRIGINSEVKFSDSGFFKYFCEPETDYDFKATVWLKIDTESKANNFNLTVKSRTQACDPYWQEKESNKRYHDASLKWYAMRKQKIARQ